MEISWGLCHFGCIREDGGDPDIVVYERTDRVKEMAIETTRIQSEGVLAVGGSVDVASNDSKLLHH